MKNKIKKALSLAMSLVMVLSLFGCGKENNEIDETKGTTESNETVGTNQDTNSPYAEDQVLFVAQNRYDLEEDSHIKHFYNYKGELLSSNDTSRTSVYYVPTNHKGGLSPALDFVSSQYGYVTKNGDFAIEPKFGGAYPFSDDGIALVINEKYMYIDTNGEQVFTDTFDFATSFYENGYAIVGIGDYPYGDCNYGVIDSNGKYIIEPQYYSICDIEGEYILCRNNEIGIYHIYNLLGELIYELNLVENSQYGDYLYCRGKNIFAYSEETNIIYIFNGKEFVVYDKTIINEETKIITAEESGRGYGVSYKGESVIPCEYQNIIFMNGYYIAENSYLVESYDIYNENFEKTAEGIEYDLTDYISYTKYSYNSLPEGYFYIIEEDERDGKDMYGIIDYTGKIIIEPVFVDNIYSNIYESTGLFRHTNNGRPI